MNNPNRGWPSGHCPTRHAKTIAMMKNGYACEGGYDISSDARCRPAR